MRSKETEVEHLYVIQDILLQQNISYDFEQYDMPGFTVIDSVIEQSSLDFFNEKKEKLNDSEKTFFYSTDTCETFLHDIETYQYVFNTDEVKRTFMCSEDNCNRIFFTEKALTFHNENVHKVAKELFSGANVISLEKSDKGLDLIKRTRFIQPRKAVQENRPRKEYKCLECKKIYKNHNGLKYHNNKKHPTQLIKK
ncbi:hypothetical protein NUSPORA_00481 [Nucleospora cyclopteri]